MIKVIKKLRKKASKTAAAKPGAKAKVTTKPAAKKVVKKAVKKGSKKISQQEYFAMVEKKAYEFYVNRGYADGDAVNDWQAAEKFIKANIGK